MQIKKQIGSDPENTTWLQLQGRAEVLEWDYEDALGTLKAALLLKPNDPSLLNRMQSTALFERAESQNDQTNNPKSKDSKASSDLGRAADDLEKALKLRPNDPVALFNLAVIYEKLECRHAAIAVWKKYLAIDSMTRWANEASETFSTNCKNARSTMTMNANAPWHRLNNFLKSCTPIRMRPM